MKKFNKMVDVNFRSLITAILFGGIIFLSSCSKEQGISPITKSTENQLSSTGPHGLNKEGVATMNLHLKLFIEGFYSGNGLMENGDNGSGVQVGLLNTLFVKENSRDIFSEDPNDVDFVHVSFFKYNLAQGTALEQVGAIHSGVLKVNGELNIDAISDVPDGVYFLKVNHRNTIETWSSVPVDMASGKTTNYDFSGKISSAFGENMIDVATPLGERTPVFAFFSGDISQADPIVFGQQDGIIESQDYSDMENQTAITALGYNPADITGDGIVESADFSLMENNTWYTRKLISPIKPFGI